MLHLNVSCSFLPVLLGFCPVSLTTVAVEVGWPLQASSMAFLCLLQLHGDCPVLLSFTQSLELRLLNAQIWCLCSLSFSPFPPLLHVLPFSDCPLYSAPGPGKRWHGYQSQPFLFIPYFSFFGAHFPAFCFSLPTQFQLCTLPFILGHCGGLNENGTHRVWNY